MGIVEKKMETIGILRCNVRAIWGLHGDCGKENGNYRNYRCKVRAIWGYKLYGDYGKWKRQEWVIKLAEYTRP